jgi:hypothetical protein
MFVRTPCVNHRYKLLSLFRARWRRINASQLFSEKFTEISSAAKTSTTKFVVTLIRSVISTVALNEHDGSGNTHGLDALSVQFQLLYLGSQIPSSLYPP